MAAGLIKGISVLVVGLVLSASRVAVEAQHAGTVPRVGYLGFPNEPPEGSPHRDGFLRGLAELGYVPGQSVVVEVRRYATDDQLREALHEFARRKLAVIFVGPPFAARAAKQVTQEIPIVCGSCGDPVENGLAVSLARPGGNVTGLASLSAELIAKRLELVKELFPDISRVAVFVFPTNPGTRPTLKALDEAGRALGIAIHRVEIRRADDFDHGFQSAAAGGAKAVVLQDDPLTRSARTRIVQLARRYRLPVSSGLPEVAEVGALITYGPDRVELFRRAAGVVDKILKGAKPAALPFEQATKLDLILNVTTAKELGVVIPQAILLRADRVIE